MSKRQTCLCQHFQLWRITDHNWTARKGGCDIFRKTTAMRNYQLCIEMLRRFGEGSKDMLLLVLERAQRGINKRASVEFVPRKRYSPVSIPERPYIVKTGWQATAWKVKGLRLLADLYEFGK